MIKALKFLGLTDRNDNLSLTNLAVMICIFKLATLKNFNVTDVGALIVSMSNYAHKRIESNDFERNKNDK